MKDKILIVSGDPNSINSEIIYKVWKNLNSTLRKKIYFISNFRLIKSQFKKLNYSCKVVSVNDINEKSKFLKIINVKLQFKNCFNVSNSSASRFVIKSLNLAHKLALNKKVMGIINCPIDKKLLIKNKIGVTEFLAKKCGIKDNSEVMLIKSDKFSVCPITTHIDVKDVPKKINVNLIVKKIKTIELGYKKLLRKKPKIGILGLNPHNAEFRKNSEECKKIIPAINKLKRLGIKLSGPLVADTIFIKDYKKYDVIVGMFHDQVLGPFKALYKFDAINITLGLKYLRSSPDHGTALNLVKKNMADKTSLLRCVEFLNRFGK